jgi:beta-N-acetylhexosaminidase
VGVKRIVLTPTLGLAAGALLLSACSNAGGDATTAAGTGADAPSCTQEEQIAQMELDRRVAQLLMGGVNTDGGEYAVQSAIDSVVKGHVGGVNFLGSGSYAYSDNQLAQAIDAGGQIPPFLAVDEEGGRVQRLADQTGYVPSAREMSQTMTPREVKDKAESIGETMADLSLNMDLAPVVDVSDQPDDAVIGNRSFGDTPAQVTRFAGAFADGLRSAGIIPVLKHFPGLGSGSANTDFAEAETPPLSKLQKKDLRPYEDLLQDSPVAVMVTNASVPGLTEGDAASLSPATYSLLRDDLGFDGVIMTDSLSAAAVLARMDVGEAAETAIQSGADIALWDGISEAPQIKRAVMRAVRKGKLSEDRLNDSVRRILALKGVDLCAGR